MNEHTIITWQDFEKIEMRVGTIISADIFKEAKQPAYILKIDFGPLGIKKSSAQITKRYQPDQLVGRQIIAVTNFPPKQIATIKSECLVMGAMESDCVTLLTPDMAVPNGTRIG